MKLTHAFLSLVFTHTLTHTLTHTRSHTLTHTLTHAHSAVEMRDARGKGKVARRRRPCRLSPAPKQPSAPFARPGRGDAHRCGAHAQGGAAGAAVLRRREGAGRGQPCTHRRRAAGWPNVSARAGGGEGAEKGDEERERVGARKLGGRRVRNGGAQGSA